MSAPASAFPALRLLTSVAAIYAVFGVVHLVWFIARFHAGGISSAPSDWADMAGMLAALFGPPLALGSVALVLRSVQLQQEQVATQQRQFEEMLARENSKLDPAIQRVEFAAISSWDDGTPGGGEAFHLTVQGDATWLGSNIPGGSNPVAITGPDGKVEVILWKDPDSSVHWGFLEYQRANGTQGQYRITVTSDASGPNGLGFSLSQTSRPFQALPVALDHPG